MSQKTFNKPEEYYLNDLWMVSQGTFIAFLMLEDYLIHVQKQTEHNLYKKTTGNSFTTTTQH